MKLYTPLIYKAMQVAYDAHHGQTDKSGIPYIFHPAFLACQMDTEEEIITALLHDVVEDTSVSLSDLEKAGFPPSVVEAIRLLSHSKQDEYMDYVQQLKQNHLAVKVKLADLRHNSNPTRVAGAGSPENVARRHQKYNEAIQLLEKNDVENA